MASKKNNKKERFSNSVRIENRKARFEYEVVDTWEAGIALTGNEVKSIRQGQASLQEVYASVKNEQIWLKGMHIKPYEEGGIGQDPTRDRKLLLHKKEISRIIGLIAQKGFTLIPLKLYFTDKGWAKVLLGLCRGKKKHDKRETIRQRDLDRELQRNLKIR